MDRNTAAVVIQRWFRANFAKTECVISHTRFLSAYEVVLDKQSYNANEMYINLKHSSMIPHNRREITERDVELIHARYNPFDDSYKRPSCRHNLEDLEDDIYGSSPKAPITLKLNKNSILCVR